MSYNTKIRLIQGGEILEVAAGGTIRFGDAADAPALSFDGATVCFDNLPAADPGVAGALWNNAGALAVSLGY